MDHKRMTSASSANRRDTGKLLQPSTQLILSKILTNIPFLGQMSANTEAAGALAAEAMVADIRINFFLCVNILDDPVPETEDTEAEVDPIEGIILLVTKAASSVVKQATLRGTALR